MPRNSWHVRHKMQWESDQTLSSPCEGLVPETIGGVQHFLENYSVHTRIVIQGAFQHVGATTYLHLPASSPGPSPISEESGLVLCLHMCKLILEKIFVVLGHE